MEEIRNSQGVGGSGKKDLQGLYEQKSENSRVVGNPYQISSMVGYGYCLEPHNFQNIRR